MNQISYGKASATDALRISILLQTVYIETYAVEGVTFEFTHFIAEKFSPERITSIIQKNPNQFVIAYCNQNPIGVAEIILEGHCPIRKKKVPELSKLYVLKRFNGKGVGYGLLKAAEKMVVANGSEELNLEVYIQNHRAITFYKKQGYISIGHVDFPMEMNTYENLVMNKRLN